MEDILAKIKDALKPAKITYKNFTVFVSGYKYFIINLYDEELLIKVRESFPHITFLPDKQYVCATHGAIDIRGTPIIHIFAKLKYRVGSRFNEYQEFPLSSKILILLNYPQIITSKTRRTKCGLCLKSISTYYVKYDLRGITHDVCIPCAAKNLLPTKFIYRIPNPKNIYMGNIEKHEGILACGSRAYIFCNKFRECGIINYVVAHLKVLASFDEIYIYENRVKTYYLDKSFKIE